jgi:DNA-binding NtrC family response regulator
MCAITPEAMKCMLQYEWPGNVRELENAVERAVALGSHEAIDVQALPPAVRSVADLSATKLELRPGSESEVSDTDLEALERLTIERVFQQVNGDKTLAGKMLGISRATLYRKLKRYNIAVKPSSVGEAVPHAAGH